MNTKIPLQLSAGGFFFSATTVSIVAHIGKCQPLTRSATNKYFNGIADNTAAA